MSYSGQKASVKLPYGVYPVGGTVDGVCQMKHHKDMNNELPKGKAVKIVEECVAAVTAWGNFCNNEILNSFVFTATLVGIQRTHFNFIDSRPLVAKAACNCRPLFLLKLFHRKHLKPKFFYFFFSALSYTIFCVWFNLFC